MRIAVFQMQSVAANMTANLKSIETAAFAAVDKEAELLVTPELALPGYGAGDLMKELSLSAGSTIFDDLKTLSVTSGISLVVGFSEKEGDALYNSAAYFNGEAAPIIYRKTHLYGDYERSLFTPAAPAATLFELAGIKIGMLICYDVEFPENVRRLAKVGADLILVPTALPQGEFGSFIARQLVPVRAFENQVFVAYTNHCGNDGVYEYKGLSSIAAPDGSLLAAAGEAGEQLLIADIDPQAFTQSFEQNSYLKDLE